MGAIGTEQLPIRVAEPKPMTTIPMPAKEPVTVPEREKVRVG